MMIRFIDTHKDLFGVEPICRTLAEHLDGGFITSRGYRAAKARVPAARTLSDQLLIPELLRIHQENYGVYGVRKMWQAMRRAGWAIGRDQTYRLMRAAGIQGVHRGRKPVTTRATKAPDNRPDLVNRQFTADAPHRLWVADFTYVRTTSGFCYTAFITDVFSRKIVGWGVSSTMHTLGMPLTALKQALFDARKCGSVLTEIVHHSDRGPSTWLRITRVSFGAWVCNCQLGQGAIRTIMLWLSRLTVRIRQSLCVAGSLSLLLSWRLRRRVGCVGGMSSGCIRPLVIGLRRRWWMVL